MSPLMGVQAAHQVAWLTEAATERMAPSAVAAWCGSSRAAR